MQRAVPVFLAAALASYPLFAQPANLRNAKTSIVAVEREAFARQLRALASPSAPRWIGWTAPLVDRRQRMCCYGDREPWQTRADGRFGCGRCRLEGEGSFSMNRDDQEGARLEDPEEFLLFARVASGRVEKLRHFSLDCEIDAGGMPVVWLEGVRPEEGVAWLESLVGRPAPTGRARNRDEEDEEDGDDDGRVSNAAVAGIALQAGPAAQAALERLIARGQPYSVRKKAAFWMAAVRGRAGCVLLEKIVPADPEEVFRRHGTFVLSLCRGAEAVGTLMKMARSDAAAQVRGQALFWLAQKAGRKAAAAIDDAIRNDPDTEVKKRAVFALTQMPDGEGVPALIRVARTNRNPEVRERAIFWLGQSKDPRALDFIEEILTK